MQKRGLARQSLLRTDVMGATHATSSAPANRGDASTLAMSIFLAIGERRDNELLA